MGKPDGLSRHSGQEKSGMDGHFFNERQLLDLKNDNIGEEVDAEDGEWERIDVAIWEKQNALLVVPEEHRLQVLWQHYDSQVAGY